MTWTHWRCSGRESSTWKTNSSTPISSTISKTISMTPTSTDLIFSSFFNFGDQYCLLCLRILLFCFNYQLNIMNGIVFDCYGRFCEN
ncbi:hypothetical protein OIU74_022777 [Salix koriyanagi]|uniref:Uncharacterized protein n=1 Tax=Salix koriyanagi TaxID=2511006 RepID=A0A9Q0WKX2_9ROSI|nr:hypothetical protein OIU74_022777 [Salix koriyanagi]